jgi:DNA primase
MMNVSYLVEPKPHLWYLRGRIIIPVYLEGKLIGWQARYLGEQPNLGKPPSKDIPKYIFSSGFPRSRALYNFDNAKQQPFVVVVEGATKVWRFGPEAVATFGKCVTSQQIALLAARWTKIVVMLDPNAEQESAELVASLKPYRQVVEVRPPVEPDEMDTRTLRGLVFATAQKQGINLLESSKADGS